MRPIITPWNRTVGLVAGIACIAAFARGQQNLLQSANVVAYNGQPVPGVPGVTISGATNIDSACIDDSGAVLFRARLAGAGVTPLNERAFFRGTTSGDLAVLIRSQDPAPGLPGLTLNTATTTGIGNSPREASNGLTLWGSSLSGPGVTTLNDTALFGGFAGSLGLVAREGDPAPGTVGATFGSGLNNLSYQPTSVIRNGRVLFQSATLGGDTTSANNAAWFSGSPGALELIFRKGTALPSGQVVGALGTISQMNDSGQVMFEAVLSTTLGTPPATTSNDQTLWIYTPGVGAQLVAREGDPAPGTAGATLNHGTSPNSFFFGTGGDNFNNAGEGLVQCELVGGDVIPGVNNRGLYLVTTGGLTMLIRRGTPAPGTDGVYDTINHVTSHYVNGGKMVFNNILAGGTQTPTTDSGVWAGTPGNMQLIAREGNLAPGTPGAIFGDFNGRPNLINEQGRVLFQAKLVPGIGGVVEFVNDLPYYCWDPSVGLVLVGRPDDLMDVAPGDTRRVASLGHVLFSNGDGNPLGFNRNGKIALRLSYFPAPFSSSAVLTFDFPTPSAPTIATQPSNAVACAGGSASFSVTATGLPYPTYQWMFNNSPLSDGGAISGSTTATLTVNPVAVGDFGSYTCVVTNASGSVTTSPATLAITPTDTDGDGTVDCNDGCPNDPLKIAPGQCGCGNPDTDTDGDLTADCNDGCPLDPLKIAPGICGCGVPDTDTDLDGTADCNDGCPLDPLKIAPGQCGCGVPDVDTDGDGALDCLDGCPLDPLKIAPGQCGCGNPDTDTDSDGTADCNDGCPTDPLKIAPGPCGCGVPDTDTDLDGTPDCNDGCPTDPLKTAPGVCGCGNPDVDSDTDGFLDCQDNCPNLTNPAQTDSDSDGVGDGCDNCESLPNPGQEDCNDDGIGDVCAIVAGAPDCNLNGVPDTCDIAAGTSFDVNGNTIPDECEQDGGSPFCFGNTGCPCGNNSAPSEFAGCKNATPFGGRLVGVGNTSVSNDTLSLQFSHLTGQIAVIFQSQAITQVPFSDGLKCLSGPLIRIGTGKPVVNGEVSYPTGSQPLVSVKGLVPATGGVRYYQGIYRSNGGPCGTGLNISNGLSVVWVP